MPSESNSSARSSAPTSSSAAKNQPRSEAASEAALAELSEADFLARQQNDAKAAIQRVAGDIAGDIGRSVDPRGWMRAAPWTTLATAVLVGFAGTALVVPSKEEQALRRLRRLEKALRDADENRRNGNGRSGGRDNGHDDGDRDRSGGHSILGTLLGHAVQLLKPLISSAITAAVAANTVQPPPAADPTAAAGGSTSDIS